MQLSIKRVCGFFADSYCFLEFLTFLDINITFLRVPTYHLEYNFVVFVIFHTFMFIYTSASFSNFVK